MEALRGWLKDLIPPDAISASVLFGLLTPFISLAMFWTGDVEVMALIFPVCWLVTVAWALRAQGKKALWLFLLVPIAFSWIIVGSLASLALGWAPQGNQSDSPTTGVEP